MRAPFGLLLATVTLLPSPLLGQAADRFAGVRGTIQPFLDSTGTASVAVAVAEDGKIVWEEGFGGANRERRIRADQHTMYSLASISKPITATA
ncbi:MAG TPA: serine hydrolase domain-containing protein [Longimicrobiales bacterium]|nr:serine hydrolase domain-containing protein [Longimicrobiales bacterium]